jgi:ATP-dependent Clp protease ATP-binding subunit ClpX
MDDFHCSFCGKRRREVKKLISGPRVFICDECTALCVAIIKKENETKETTSVAALSGQLAGSIVGQGSVARMLAYAFLRHVVRARDVSSADAPTWPEAVLLSGPIGTGKTVLVETVAALCKLPLIRVDARRFRGASLFKETNVWASLLDAAAADVAVANHGVVCIERIDRLAASGPTDVDNLDAQDLVLSLLNGREVEAVPPGGSKKEAQFLDTKAMLFVASGVFAGSAGRPLDDEALVRFGLIPELASRFRIRVAFEPLRVEELRDLLLKPAKGLLALCTGRFAASGHDVTFDAEAAEAIIAEAGRRLGGARGLRSALDTVVLEVSFLMSAEKKKSLVVTRELVELALGSSPAA